MSSKAKVANLMSKLPNEKTKEVFQLLLSAEGLKIERIVSHGHTSPSEGFYDQTDNEWVMVITGSASIYFEDGTEVKMNPYDFIDIPARTKHRVSWTDPEQPTVWLAIHYSAT